MLRGNFACFPHALNEKPLANSSCKLPFLIEYLNNEKSLLLPRAEAQILHYWCYQGWFQTMTSPITQFVFPLSQNFQILSGGWGSHFFFEVLHSVKKKMHLALLLQRKLFLRQSEKLYESATTKMLRVSPAIMSNLNKKGTTTINPKQQFDRTLLRQIKSEHVN